MRRFACFGGCSSLAIQGRIRRATSPAIPKKEEDISEMLEGLLEEGKIVESYGQSYILPAMLNILSLRLIMELKRDKVDDVVMACEGELGEGQKYHVLFKSIRQYAWGPST